MLQFFLSFNFSLRNLLSREPDSFTRARIKILFTILLFTTVKSAIVIAVAGYHNQYFQFGRALLIVSLFLTFLKLLISDKKFLKPISHIMVVSGLLLVYSNIFIVTGNINIAVLQFVFMIVVSSFYLLPKKFAVIYSSLSILPVVLFVISGQYLSQDRVFSGELASPGYEIIVVLNFITIVISHYLYHEAFNINVSEKEALNSRLTEAAEQATLAAKSKSDFLSTMSHELRTPLNSVIGMSELLLDNPHTAEQEENLKILSFSAVNLHSLVNDILDFNKLDSGKLSLEAISINVDELMNNICSGLQFQAKEKGLMLTLEVDDAIKSRRIISDPTRISQIVYNLTGNAIKFTKKGKVAVSLTVNTCDDDKMNIRVSVKDTGIGISADKHEGIFEPFVQASTSTTRNFGGTGLGLAIVKRLLKLFGSEICLASSPDNGSDFYFDILFKLDNQPIAGNIASASEEFDLTGLRVLVAEDNAMNRLLLKKVLSKWNIEPVFAENGQEAIDAISAETYDVILMDIHMPVADGFEATSAIRRMSDTAKSRVLIIALTASVSGNLPEKIKEAGMNDYIYKPFNIKNLYSKLKAIRVPALETSGSVIC